MPAATSHKPGSSRKREFFSEWLRRVRATADGRKCRILASVPLIGRPRPYDVVRRLPGVVVDRQFAAAVESGGDLAKAGLDAARDLIRRLLDLDIDGLHLMNFGMPVEAVIDLIR